VSYVAKSFVYDAKKTNRSLYEGFDPHMNHDLSPYFISLERWGRSGPFTPLVRGEVEGTKGHRDSVEALRWSRSDEHCHDHIAF
jgi:hypothetical protein